MTGTWGLILLRGRDKIWKHLSLCSNISIKAPLFTDLKVVIAIWKITESQREEFESNLDSGLKRIFIFPARWNWLKRRGIPNSITKLKTFQIFLIRKTLHNTRIYSVSIKSVKRLYNESLSFSIFHTTYKNYTPIIFKNWNWYFHSRPARAWNEN